LNPERFRVGALTEAHMTSTLEAFTQLANNLR